MCSNRLPGEGGSWGRGAGASAGRCSMGVGRAARRGPPGVSLSSQDRRQAAGSWHAGSWQPRRTLVAVLHADGQVLVQRQGRFKLHDVVVHEAAVVEHLRRGAAGGGGCRRGQAPSCLLQRRLRWPTHGGSGGGAAAAAAQRAGALHAAAPVEAWGQDQRAVPREEAALTSVRTYLLCSRSRCSSFTATSSSVLASRHRTTVPCAPLPSCLMTW